MVKHVDPLPGYGQKRPLPLLLTSALARLGEVAKVLPVARLATHKFLVSVHAGVGLKLLAKTIAVIHKATALPNLVLVKSLSQKLHGQTFSVFFGLYLCASPAPSNIMNSPTNIPLTHAGPVASR